MDALWKNLVYSVWMLLKRLSLTAVAITAIALGIGANTAIFSVVNAVTESLLLSLVGAGLLINSFWRLLRTDAGFDAKGASWSDRA